MSCIICNENPEKIWPKRWQSWKDNGKFAESLCKLLGLPKFPYKSDFQNSQYCSSCQKRVYNVYLMMRKWDKLQDEISQLKIRLKKDFQQSLQKGYASEGSEENERSMWATTRSSTSECETEPPSSIEINNTNTVVRKRILSRMDGRHRDCDCSCDSDEAQMKVAAVAMNEKKSHCGYPDCQDKECSQNWKRNSRNNFDTDMDSSSSFTGSEMSSDSHQENGCDDEHCTICLIPEAPRPVGKMRGKPVFTAHNDVSCSSEYCADCSICKNEAKKGKGTAKTSGNKYNCGKSEATDCDNHPSKIRIKKEVCFSGSLRENIKLNPIQELVGSESLEPTTNESDKQDNCPITTGGSSKIQFKIEPDIHEPTTPEVNNDDAAGDNDASVYDFIERFRCYRTNCTRTFLTQDDLDIHVKRHHEGIKCPYACQQCDKSFQWRRELNAHVLKHSGEVAICCDLCGRGFRTQQLFNVHVKTKHDGERKFKCSKCDKSFISESKLNTHLTTHTKVYPFSCIICGKGFAAKTFLNFHMSKHMEANPYQCTTCEKTFSSPRNLTVHQYTHTKTHPYKCVICEAGATSETMLKKHMLKHNSEKANVCTICNKKFRFPSSLKKHEKVHNGQKEFVCEFCDKTFIDKYKLTRHRRTHSGDKPFICSTCKQSFATLEYLNKHVQKCHENEQSNNIYCISSSFLDQATELQPLDIQLPEINEPLSAYLPDGFHTDPSFLDNLNPDDEGLVVTALDLENFSKEELMMTDEKPDLVLRQGRQTATSFENSIPNSTMLPDFHSFRTSSTTQLNDDFPTFTFQHL